MPRPLPSLRGVLPPLTTPFDDAGELDLEGLERNLDLYNATGLVGYLPLGSNGEAAHLTAGEARRVLETVRERAVPGKAVVAGVNELSTRGAVEAARVAADAGADAALVITPYFYKSAMTRDALRAFYLEVADAAPLPILIYTFPQNTGVTIAPELVAELAEHENVVGVKDSSGNLGALADVVRRAPADFQVLSGNAGILYPALAMGAAGAILAAACLAPEACVEIDRAARAGDHRRARELQERLSPLAALVTSGLGVAGLKAALDLAGYAGGPPRGPLRPVAEIDRRRIREAMAASGFFDHLGEDRR